MRGERRAGGVPAWCRRLLLAAAVWLALGSAALDPRLNPAASAAEGADDDETLAAEADRKLAEALDRIRDRFGRAVITHGAAALREGAPGERRWGR